MMTTHWLERDGGRVAYSDEGAGPLVVCVPGIGDLRQEYRFLAPRLIDAGFRVVTVDLRGHGESSPRWRDVSPQAIGGDVLALVRHLDAGPALVIGNSRAASGAVWVASEASDAVAGTVLIGPFVRDVGPALQRVLFPLLARVLFVRPWGVGAWMSFWGRLFPSAKPADFDDYAARLRANLREPGRLAALRAMLVRRSGVDFEARLARVQAPSLLVMGTADPDFPNPAAEARGIAGLMGGDAAVELVEGAGHYPHVEFAEHTGALIVRFARRVFGREDAGAA